MNARAAKAITATFEQFLAQHDEEAWSATITTLLRSIHEIDRTATQIWFAFYPLALWRALQQAEDPEKLARQLLLQGNYYLKDQIYTSHRFLYGHRYWPAVKSAVEQHANRWRGSESESDQSPTEVCAASLSDQILGVARDAASQLKVDHSLLIGITAVAFMTVQQAGLEAFRAARGNVIIDQKHAKKSPEQILKERAKNDGQGLLGFLKTVDKKWT